MRILGSLAAAAALAATLIVSAPASPAAAASPLQLGAWVADPSGADRYGDQRQLNRETIVLRNTGRTTLNLAGYRLVDNQRHTFVFSRGFVLRPGASVTVHTGRGRNSATHLYWNQVNYVWNNTGDKATVTDTRGRALDTCTYKAHRTGTTRC